MKKKVLLMGKSGSGKTSMRSIIFANYIARDTMRLGATMDVEASHVRFLGNLVLNLWDCGGQDSFMENYLSSQRDHIFRNVQVLIYVFDVESRDAERDVHYYRQCVEALQQNSNDAKIFCLIHKMDLISEELRDQVYKQKEAELKQLSLPQKITCFKTSIWDETLYRAWSSIVYALIPNVRMVESRLEKFCRICEADEVVLFEKATFLVISHATRGESSSSSSSTSSTSAALPSITSAGSSTSELSNGQNATSPTATGATMGTSSGASSTSAAAITMPQAGNAATSSASSSSAGSVPPHERDPHRFEKISNIIKQFKLSCSKSQAQFSSMEVRNAHFSAYITEFTANTYVMVIVSDPSIQSTATLVNIRIARKHFDPWMKNE